MRIALLFLPALLLQAQSNNNYKETGSSTAPILLEVYSDYECPYCGVFFRDVVPKIMSDYVQTGKVRFVHRDFPMAMHPHASIAARYANAAGELGYYETAVNQIFRTQDSWSAYGRNTGDIDAELTKVLPPGAMQKLRGLVKDGPRLDKIAKQDMDDGVNLAHVTGTPTVIVIAKGKRETISTPLPFSIWKSYLDAKLAAR